MITAGNRFHILLIATHNTDMTKITETEMESHLIESGTEVIAPNTKRKSELYCKTIHINMLFNFSFIGGRGTSPRREKPERQKREE
jgi:hypothetical protein